MSSFGSRTILIVALVAATIGGIATYGVSALTGTAKTEVRITAQRLDDGRVEFALQQRARDGAWGERLLPARRYFPAEGFVNRWANSTPLEIDSGIPFYINTTEPTRPVTVDEYVALCGDQESWLTEEGGAALEDLMQQFLDPSTGEEETLTWGAMLRVVDVAITAWRSIEPPDELAEYHRAQVALFTLIAQYAYTQPAEAEFDVWELFGIALIAGAAAQEAEVSLDPDLRQRLVDGGCIEADDSGFDE